MEAPSPRYILTRAAFIIALVVVVLYGISFFKRYQRQSNIVAELKLISSDSSFFKQFYPEDARKSLVRAVALVAEANELGQAPETTIDRALGVEKKYFNTDGDKAEPPPRAKLIRLSLRSNYENFLKVGYKPDFHTLAAMKQGALPAIPNGPDAGKKAIIANIIDPSLSPGIDTVIANLEIRPPQLENRPRTDVETALAKQLARDLYYAAVIEEAVSNRIVEHLSKSEELPSAPPVSP
jgi:hypothetical protein